MIYLKVGLLSCHSLRGNEESHINLGYDTDSPTEIQTGNHGVKIYSVTAK
jgi:hypothetical protein